MRTTTKCWVGLGVLAALSPIGLLLPERFKSGTPWGEWGPEGVQSSAGYLPRGLGGLADLWKAPFPDYAFKGWQDKGMGHLSLAYVLSGAIGITSVALVFLVLGRVLAALEGRKGRVRRSFIQRSIMGVLSFVKDSVSNGEYAAKPGWMQSLDPRTRVVTVLVFLLLVLHAVNTSVIVLYYLACLLLAVLSGIGPGYFLARTLLFIPLFSLFAAIPILFGVISPGRELFGFHLFGQPFVVTREGLSGMVLFLSRVAASVSFSILLVLTVKHDQMLKALRTFKVPRTFVMTLGMCYRYIFLFVTVVENTYQAIKSRCGLSVGSRDGRRIVAWNMAGLWNRSYWMHNEVYNAMASRGYQGESHALDEFNAGKRDFAWLSFLALVSLLSLSLDRWIGKAG